MATVRLAETYEEDSLTAVISFLQNLLNEGKVGPAGAALPGLEGRSGDQAPTHAHAFAAPQGKTSLADTPGSLFAAECNKLVEANRFDELIALMSSHVGLITSSAAPKGAPLLRARCKREPPPPQQEQQQPAACPAPATGQQRRSRALICRRGRPACGARGCRQPRATKFAGLPPTSRGGRARPAPPPARPLPRAPDTRARRPPPPDPPPADAECCLAVMAHLVKKVVSAGGEDAESAAAGKLAAALSAKVRRRARGLGPCRPGPKPSNPHTRHGAAQTLARTTNTHHSPRRPRS
jgi:hypothetical protein